MNTKILLQIIIGLLIVVGGVTSYVYFGQNKKVVDCGTDQNCFAENLKTCTPSKIGGGATIIKGGSVNNCELYFEGASPSDPKTPLGLTCLINVTDTTTAMGKSWLFKDANIAAYILFNKMDSCQGPYKDELTKMVEKARIPKP